MNFEEWCNSIGMEDSRVVEADLISMTILKKCWDYQKNIINQLKEELEKEREVNNMVAVYLDGDLISDAEHELRNRQKERVSFE